MRMLVALWEVGKVAFVFGLRGSLVGWWLGGCVGALVGIARLLPLIPSGLPLFALLWVVHQPALAAAQAAAQLGFYLEAVYGLSVGGRASVREQSP